MLRLPAFRPPAWLRGGHAQTVYAAVFTGVRGPESARQHETPLPDGDRLVLHDDQPPTWRPGDWVALLVHGLGGSHASPYVVRAARKLNARGVRCLRMDMRGCGAGMHVARRHWHAGRSDDLGAALDFTRRLCPDSPITLVGYSLGGNIVLKLLGELGDGAPPELDSAMAVGPPIDLLECARNLRRGMNRVYDWTFIENIHDHLRERRRRVPGLADRPLRPLPRRLFEWDHFFTAPLVGFRSAEEYYQRCSPGPLLRQARRPTLVLAAADDPLVPPVMFDWHPRAECVQLHLTEHGGHLGYYGVAGDDPDRRWLDWRVVEWIAHRQARREASAG